MTKGTGSFNLIYRWFRNIIFFMKGQISKEYETIFMENFGLDQLNSRQFDVCYAKRVTR